MLKNLILLLTFFPACVFAQSTINGRVVSMVNKNGVSSASVFLSNTSVGTTTIADGTYRLDNVKNGQYDLVVKCLGYEPYHQTVMVNNADLKLDAIELMPKVTALSEVTVKYDPDREKYDLNSNKSTNMMRKAQLARFYTEFLGRTDNASECKILNPDVLDMYYEPADRSLKANSADFLLIENHALGYRIKYLLKEFYFNPTVGDIYYGGSFIFEPLPGDEGQQKKWQKKRIAAYRGSDMHFLRACIADQVPEEGFTVYGIDRKMNDNRASDSLIQAKTNAYKISGYNIGVRDSLRYWVDQAKMIKYNEKRTEQPLTAKNYVWLTQTKGIFAIGYPNRLQITYKNKLKSTIIFHEPLSFFDSNGVIVNPKSNTMEGAWAFQRVAELLPVDYELPTTF